MRKSKMSLVAAFVLVWVVPLCGCNPGGVKTYEEGSHGRVHVFVPWRSAD